MPIKNLLELLHTPKWQTNKDINLFQNVSLSFINLAYY